MLTSFQSAPEPRTLAHRLLRAVEYSFYALALAPVAFIAWQAVALLRNIPMWDEFETVLKFLVRYESMSSLRDAIGPLFALANEHCMVTSRLIVLALFELTGEANFIHLAVVGNLSVVGVVMLLVRHESNRLVRLLLGALTSLFIFQLQHHENFFSSYASIDHFLVVLLTTATLVWVVRGGVLALWGAGVMSVLAVFTLAHGTAVLAAAALVLALQQRWRHLAGWMAGSLIIAGLFAWRLSGAPLSLTPPLTLAGLEKMVVYWLSLLGGVPALGNQSLAMLFGVFLLVILGGLTWKASYRRDPLLWGVAVNAILAALLIAYGRAGSPDVSPLSSRYMVQSAMAWSATLIMLLKLLGSPWRILAWGAALVVVAGSANVAASVRYLPNAREFVQRRIDAARHYDLAQSLVGMRRPIYPQGREADAILAEAAKTGGLPPGAAQECRRRARCPAGRAGAVILCRPHRRRPAQPSCPRVDGHAEADDLRPAAAPFAQAGLGSLRVSRAARVAPGCGAIVGTRRCRTLRLLLRHSVEPAPALSRARGVAGAQKWKGGRFFPPPTTG
jgi:hypothetical protein